MKRIALVLGLTLTLSSAALAQTPAQGVTSRRSRALQPSPPLPPQRPLPCRRERTGCRRIWRSAPISAAISFTPCLEAERRLDANPKDTAAMTLIGEIYRDGAAVARSDQEASRWFRLASNLGDPQAAYELGALLVQGENGVAKDPAAAKAQFERAAAKNHPGALYNLGVMALQGLDGKTPDYNQAAQYFLRAANAGDDDAAYSYGVMLRDGKGAPQNIGEATHWLKRAADDGIVAGQVEYAIMLFNGEGVKKDEAEAAKILLTAASRGNPIAQNRIAHLYVTGEALPKDMAKAAAWNSFAKAGGLERRRPRCRHSQSDARRAAPLHQDGPRTRRLLTLSRSRRRSFLTSLSASAFFLRVFPPETGDGPPAGSRRHDSHDDPTQCSRWRSDPPHRRAEPPVPSGLPGADRFRGRQGAGAQAPRLRQFRPWLRRLRSERQGGVAGGDGSQSRDCHRL